MRKTTLLAIALPLFFMAACGNTNTTTSTQLPRPGTIIDSASMPIADELNNFTFSIKVVADSEVAKGVYDVDVDYGPNFAQGKFTMPKGGEELRPVIRKGAAPYTYIIGFKVNSDTTFYEYYEVSADKGATKMQYIKAYSF